MHKLDIKYNGLPITSNPIETKVRNPGMYNVHGDLNCIPVFLCNMYLKVNTKHAFYISAFGREVTASGKGLYHTRVGKAASFIIHTMGQSSKEFDVIVSGPADVIPPNEAIPGMYYIQF